MPTTITVREQHDCVDQHGTQHRAILYVPVKDEHAMSGERVRTDGLGEWFLDDGQRLNKTSDGWETIDRRLKLRKIE